MLICVPHLPFAIVPYLCSYTLSLLVYLTLPLSFYLTLVSAPYLIFVTVPYLAIVLVPYLCYLTFITIPCLIKRSTKRLLTVLQEDVEFPKADFLQFIVWFLLLHQ